MTTDAVEIERRHGELGELFGPYGVTIRLDELTGDLKHNRTMEFRGNSPDEVLAQARAALMAFAERICDVADHLARGEIDVDEYGIAPKED